MNVKQALKLKGKILTEISELNGIAKNHNSIQAGNIRRFSVVEPEVEETFPRLQFFSNRARVAPFNGSTCPN